MGSTSRSPCRWNRASSSAPMVSFHSVLGLSIAIDASLDVYFGFIPLIMLIMLLPISVNGIGTTQVAFVWFFARVGTPEPDAVALSVLFQGLGIVGSLPGGLLLAFGGRGPTAPTPPASSTPSG